MGKLKEFLKRKDVVFSAHRYGIDAMGAMAQGLFASLLIGTIIKTLGEQIGLQFLVDAGTFAQSVAGPAMAASIGLRVTSSAISCATSSSVTILVVDCMGYHFRVPLTSLGFTR